MKRLLIALTVSSTLITGPLWAGDDHDKNKDHKSAKAAHSDNCKAVHGKVTAKTDTTLTVDEKKYNLAAGAKVDKLGKAQELRTVNVGDKVCLETKKADDGTPQITAVKVIQEGDKTRVRGKDESEYKEECPDNESKP